MKIGVLFVILAIVICQYAIADEAQFKGRKYNCDNIWVGNTWWFTSKTDALSLARLLVGCGSITSVGVGKPPGEHKWRVKVKGRRSTTPIVAVSRPTSRHTPAEPEPTTSKPIVTVSRPARQHTSAEPEPTKRDEPRSDVVEMDVMESPALDPLCYTMVFPKGINALRLPFQTDRPRYLTDLYEFLGDENVHFIAALRPSVQAWTIVRSADSSVDEWISPYRGFVVYMENEAALDLKAVKKGFTYAAIPLKHGDNLIGVPLESESLETVGDFFRVFPSVTSVKGIPADTAVDMPASVDVEWFEELDNDVMINGETGYLIHSTADAEYTVWGTQWTMQTSSAAPGVVREPRSIVTTWGALKQ